MEQEKKPPLRHSDLHDPKLPVIHGGIPTGQGPRQIHPAPIPQLPPEE